MTHYEELDIAGKLDALPAGVDPRPDPPDGVVGCSECDDSIPPEERLAIVWSERMCRACLSARRPEVGVLIRTLEKCRAQLERIAHTHAEATVDDDGTIEAYARVLGTAQGAAQVALAKLWAVGI